MPSHELDSNAWLTEHSESTGYTAQRGYPTAAPSPAGNPLDTLRLAIRGFAPAVCLQAYVLLDEDGFHPAVYTYHVKLSGPTLRTPVKTKGTSIVEVATAAKKAWVKERRATDIFRLVEDCQRLVGSCLEEDFEEALTYEMQGCQVSDFQVLAAKWRAKAVAYGKQAA